MKYYNYVLIESNGMEASLATRTGKIIKKKKIIIK